jgi:hypothetical protein
MRWQGRRCIVFEIHGHTDCTEDVQEVCIMAKEKVNMSRKEASDLHKKIVEHAVKKGHPVWQKKKRA